MKQKQRRIRRSARPPMTPPTIAPMGVDLEGECVGDGVGEDRLEVWEPGGVAVADDELVEVKDEEIELEDEEVDVEEAAADILLSELSVKEVLELGAAVGVGDGVMTAIDVETTTLFDVITFVDEEAAGGAALPVKTIATDPAPAVVAINVAQSDDPQPH